MRQRWLMAAMLVPLAAALMAMGCGGADDERSPVAKVECTVTVNGQPLTKGSITFTPTAGTKGRGSRGSITGGKAASLNCYKDGDGAIVGTHKVKISARKAAAATAVEGEVPAVSPELIPAEFNVKSTLIRTVKAGEVNKFTFDVKAPDSFEMP